MQSDRARFGVLTAGVIGLIAYGSLFPFRFHACAFSPAPLLGTSTIPSDRGDFLSNILLYVPLGFFAARAWRGSRWAIAGASILGFAFSFLIETTQECDFSRVPSMADVLANTAGALAGSLLAIYLQLEYAALLIACWMGARLLPYVPSAHIEKYWAAIRAAATVPSAIDVFRYFALWLAAAVLLDRRLLIAIAIVLVGRVAIVDATLVSAEILGAVLALVVWNFISRMPSRAGIVAAVVTAYIVANAIEPFHFLSRPRPFGWIPFLSFMQGSRESASRVFLEKSFMYGAMVWLSVRGGMRFRAAALGGAALVFALRVAQIYLPGRSAEITDALMVLMLAGTMKVMDVKLK